MICYGSVGEVRAFLAMYGASCSCCQIKKLIKEERYTMKARMREKRWFPIVLGVVGTAIPIVEKLTTGRTP